jgi:hypothetical protein
MVLFSTISSSEMSAQPVQKSASVLKTNARRKKILFDNLWKIMAQR